MTRCRSVYVTSSGPWGTDLVRCEKNVNAQGRHKGDHHWTYGQEGETWTTSEAEPADSPRTRAMLRDQERSSAPGATGSDAQSAGQSDF